MIIHGKERKFLLTVGASAEIAELCPDGDLSRIGEALGVSFAKNLRFIARMIAAMSRGYEENRKYMEPGYEPDPLTVNEVLSLQMSEIKELQDEAFAAFKADTAPSVEVEQPKN